jgi:hypothetical protein
LPKVVSNPALAIFTNEDKGARNCLEKYIRVSFPSRENDIIESPLTLLQGLKGETPVPWIGSKSVKDNFCCRLEFKVSLSFMAFYDGQDWVSSD